MIFVVSANFTDKKQYTNSKVSYSHKRLPLEAVNVVVSGLRDADVSYIGITTCHLVSREQEHWSLNNKAAVVQHIGSCQCCNANTLNANFF